MKLSEDNTTKGVWHYCFKCDLGGDFLDVAAGTWECDRELAADKLRAHGLSIEVPVNDSPKSRTEVEARKLLNLFKAESAFTPLTTTPAHRMIMARLGIPIIADYRWKTGPHRMFLASTVKDIRRIFMPGKAVDSCGTEQFPGRGWREVIATVFEDLPGRVCGLLCAGRRVAPGDFRYYAPNPYQNRHDAGLAGLWSLSSSRRVLGEHVIAVDSPYLAGRIHARQANFGGQPLPLIVYHDGPRYHTTHSWNCLEMQTPVFWGQYMSSAMVHHASLTNGMISVMRLTEGGLDSYLRRQEPLPTLRKAVRWALPWREALKSWAETAEDVDIAALLLQLETYGRPLTLFDVHPRIRHLLRLSRAPRTILYGRIRVTERDGRWFFKSGNSHERLLMNAVLRLDSIVPRNGGSVYEGRLIHEGDEISCRMPIYTSSDSRGPIDHLASALAKAKKQSLYVESGWGKRLSQVALAFAPLP